ncbi:LysR family transcriptional regulator [Sphingobium sp. SCG-1]|uniref:LysR family transcriptional regulator n=1 Tax=Sphingobium sp. SCG-1 TaxID=2072936 RepID=UPI000CD6BA4A|nr:LysR family transcriptional regulator [Sphingobium sp. SCG-1]AUW58027.1 LysR family transcriptional regulator [Sphingobium sp. SCG-1]
MITPTLRQLDIFAQMIASGSVAECARDLDMKQQDVEAEIARLESRLGHRLFDLQGGIATLTDAGHKTVEAMQLLTETPQEQWEDTHAPDDDEEKAVPATPEVAPEVYAHEPLPKITRGFPNLPPATEAAAAETITIAAHPAVFSHFQDALSAFEQANSDVAITLDLDVHSAAQAISSLATGRADIAYFYALDAPDGWPSRYAWSEQISLYVGETHPLSALDVVMQEDLEQAAPATWSIGNALRPLVDDALALASVAAMVPVLETDNIVDIMTAVRNGTGYFAAFGPAARDFGRIPGIRRLPLGFPIPAIEVRQAIRSAVQDDSIVLALSEYLFR